MFYYRNNREDDPWYNAIHVYDGAENQLFPLRTDAETNLFGAKGRAYTMICSGRMADKWLNCISLYELPRETEKLNDSRLVFTSEDLGYYSGDDKETDYGGWKNGADYFLAGDFIVIDTVAPSNYIILNLRTGQFTTLGLEGFSYQVPT